MSNVDLRLGDCRDILTELEDASIDAILTDTPYELGFMGKKWDNSGIAFDVEMWEQCLRVLKPGGHMLAFGGSRTWHRLAVAIEDAGFEIRDSIAWLYGSGFPKSLDVSKAIDRAAGAEREVVGPNPRAGQQTPKRDTTTLGAFAGSPSTLTAPATDAAKQWQGWGTALKPAFEPIVVARKPLVGTVAANVLEHGTGALNIDACRIGDGSESQGPRDSSEPSATRRYTGRGAVNIAATPGPRGGSPSGRWPTNVVLDEAQAAELGESQRFFPVFKYQAKAPTKERPSYVNEDGAKVAHSTVKPLTLMRWLARLVCPPGGVILDPFAGSGTTVEACLLEGFDCIAIENEPDYIPLIEHRISRSTT
ncbi:DNA methyltransferase [Mycobacterium phage Aeneas]|uniref:DNA methylase n=1 Tax=Mycobacterium phage Aeneas TaxID=1168595 RepID=I3WX45_9CAUD|nr:DNA methyltransferase [Mycobacterium phage Aeneas]AFL48073.1 DNA methylase [Mycobacterium phage Aeneas]